MPANHDVLAQWYEQTDELADYLRWRLTGRKTVTHYYGEGGVLLGTSEVHENGDGEVVSDVYTPASEDMESPSLVAEGK